MNQPLLDVKYQPHVIVLPSYVPVAICLCRGIATSIADVYYGDWESKGIVVRPAEPRDWKALK